MMLTKAVSRYQSAFPFSDPPAPSAFSLLAAGGIRPAQSFERPVTLGDIGESLSIDTLVKGAKGAVKSVEQKTERLENALTVIMFLSGVAAVTGIIGVIRR